MRLSRSCGYAWLLVLLSGHFGGCGPSPPVTSPPPQGGEPKKTEPATAPKNSENEGATSKESHDSGTPVVNSSPLDAPVATPSPLNALLPSAGAIIAFPTRLVVGVNAFLTGSNPESPPAAAGMNQTDVDFSAAKVFAPESSAALPTEGSSTRSGELPENETKTVLAILQAWNSFIDEKKTPLIDRKALLEEEARALIADYRNVFVSLLQQGDRKLARELVRQVMLPAPETAAKKAVESKPTGKQENSAGSEVPEARPIEAP